MLFLLFPFLKPAITPFFYRFFFVCMKIGEKSDTPNNKVSKYKTPINKIQNLVKADHKTLNRLYSRFGSKNQLSSAGEKEQAF